MPNSAVQHSAYDEPSRRRSGLCVAVRRTANTVRARSPAPGRLSGPVDVACSEFAASSLGMRRRVSATALAMLTHLRRLRSRDTSREGGPSADLEGVRSQREASKPLDVQDGGSAGRRRLRGSKESHAFLSSSTSAATRAAMSSRIGRTSSMGLPAGSGSSQSM